MIKCDKAMKRSKEQCRTPQGEYWRCNKDCKSCICALFKKEDGTWEHRKNEKWGH